MKVLLNIITVIIYMFPYYNGFIRSAICVRRSFNDFTIGLAVKNFPDKLERDNINTFNSDAIDNSSGELHCPQDDGRVSIEKLLANFDIDKFNKMAETMLANKEAKPARHFSKSFGSSKPTELTGISYKAKDFYALQHKLMATNKTAHSMYSLLNEVKDKAVFEKSLVEQIVLSISRLGCSKYAIAAFELYQKWVEQELVPYNSIFLKQFVLSCYVCNLLDAANRCCKILLDSGDISNSQVLPGIICKHVHLAEANRSNAAFESEIKTHLLSLHNNIKQYSMEELNIVVRVFAKYRRIKDIFTLFTTMRAAYIIPNAESLDYLTNALIISVDKEPPAKSMKYLPKPNMKIPEIVFAGRSNVGKSSLVNLLLKRRALAPTSPIPGNTKQFHFYTINAQHHQQLQHKQNYILHSPLPQQSLLSSTKNLGSKQRLTFLQRKRTQKEMQQSDTSSSTTKSSSATSDDDVQLLPCFRFVDVPGIGYAAGGGDDDDTEVAAVISENRRTSWRSLLQRYLARREPLRLVCHLIDSRHKVTPTDKEMLELAIRAAAERLVPQTTSGRGISLDLFQYVVVLTKADKSSQSAIAATIANVKSISANIVDILYAEQLKLQRHQLQRSKQNKIINNNDKFNQTITSADIDTRNDDNGDVASVTCIDNDDNKHFNSLDDKKKDDDDDYNDDDDDDEQYPSAPVSVAASLLPHLKSLLNNITIITTSSKTKLGADELWRLLQNVVSPSI